MKILAILHGFPPLLNAGGEYYMYNWLKYLTDQGHFVTVRVPISNMTPYEIDGIKVERDVYPETKKDLLTTDIMISHLNCAGHSVNVAEFNHKPLVLVQHNHNVFHAMFAKHKPHAHERFLYGIYNSQHVKDKCNYPNPHMIMYPPVYSDRVKVAKKGSHITLVNCWEKKGGDVFQSIASRMPDEKFLGVKGGYAQRHQLEGTFSNITYMENTPDMKMVYGKTKIVLMPSVAESWGMVAIEAAASGIPTIAAPTPGLVESLGDAGIFVERENIDGWVDAINQLNDPEFYKEQSKKVVKRFKELEAIRDKQLAESEQFLQDIINRKL